MGHTTRCIPLIAELTRLQCNVLIACNSFQKALLAQEFPSLTYIDLPGYELHYGKKRRLTLLKIIFQLPKILIRIKQENRWLKALLARQPVHAVISDNRFGLFNRHVHCIFITHQLGIKSGLGKWADRLTQRWNYRQIKKFDACWVPDYQQHPVLAGQLSHPGKLPSTTINYLGGLSRFTSCAAAIETIDLLIILSGPEPQRSIFESLLLNELGSYTGKVVLVRGLPGNTHYIPSVDTITVYNHVPAEQLNALMCSARLIISRSGYTTVMDVLKLGKKSILVPTPGQAEQEYLAEYLQQQHLAYTTGQTNFSLQKTLQAVTAFSFRIPPFPMEEYKIVLREFVQSLHT